MCKIGWTDQEDEILVSLKEKQLIESWCKIGQTLNQKVIGKNRTGKQCRERYINHLKVHVKKDAWEKEEEVQLFQLYKKHGSHWTTISTQLQGRSENFVKNKFYGSIRKILRLINKVAKEKIQKRSKPIKYESILRIIQIAEDGWDSLREVQSESEQLRDQIFLFILSPEIDHTEEIIQLIERIHKFNLKTRCYGLKKKKSSKVKKEVSPENTVGELSENHDDISHPVKIEEQEDIQAKEEVIVKEEVVESPCEKIWEDILEREQDPNDPFKLPQINFSYQASLFQSKEELDKEFYILSGFDQA